MSETRSSLLLVAALAATLAVNAATGDAAPAKAAAAPGKKATAKAPVAGTPASAAVLLPDLTVQQIIERHAAARGGLSAWKVVTAIEYKGKMGAGATTYEAVTPKLALERRQRDEAVLPFVLQLKRPAMQRLELTFNGQTAVQEFDGKHGYKYRPFLNRTDWEPYSDTELKSAAAQPGIDGWLLDSAAKGTRVELSGKEAVDGQPAYRLKVIRKDGQVRSVWVDGKSFLEVKEEGEPRRLDGRPHEVSVFLRDYRAEQGLVVPHTIETAVQGVARTEKITIESVSVNPRLDDARFTHPK